MAGELPFVHVGIVVESLEEAMPRFEKLGVRFMEPRVVHVDRLVEDGRETSLDLRIAFSLEGPPQWELLEAVGDGIYSPRQIGSLHHVAVLDPDPQSRLQALVADGYRLTAAQYRADGSMIVGYLDPSDLAGVRIELLHEPVQQSIMAWVAGDDATP